MSTIASSVLNSFTQNFSAAPRLFFSPGRINLIGEHVDYNDGFVMPAAIDKGVYYAVAANDSDQINFISLDYDEKYSTKLDTLVKSDGWKNYVLSVVNEFVLLDKNARGFDCVFSGDIPLGAGMSSSAAVEGGLAFALNEIFNTALDRVEMALLCQRAEHNFPNVQCGIMDQFANMMGKSNQVILLDCKSMQHQYLPIRLHGNKIVLINTKVHHSLASGEYNIRRKRCETGLAVLKVKFGVQSFREVVAEQLESVKSEMDEKVYNCCRFVIEEIARTQQAASLLQQDDVEGFGRLMYAAHDGLSKLYEVSCEELDYLVELAGKFPAVIGSRMMGGGFGGCTINLVKGEEVDHFVTEISKSYQQHFDIEPSAYIVEPADGTREIAITP